MDLEGHTNRLLKRGLLYDEVVLEISRLISEVKDIDRNSDFCEKMARAVVDEVKSAESVKKTGTVFYYKPSGVTMGDFGVGSRGFGDFYAHEKLAEVIGKTGAVVDSSDMDDSGIVSCPEGSEFVVVTVDGIHSRLSAFPFLSGFHVARAALRDIYTMGSRPIAMLSDIHIADDGDISALFDHIAGVSVVGDATGVPLITGSTLRIGGDMVIGDRMSGCVGSIGVLPGNVMTSRKSAMPGDLIIMTKGAGGGTVTTAAIFSGYDKASEVVEKTLNIDFLKACDLLIESNLVNSIHAMTDVTNGGLRGDAFEISKSANVSLIFYEEKVEKCIQEDVLEMFQKLNIDPLGVSTDSLLIICPESTAAEIYDIFLQNGISAQTVGRVEEGTGSFLIDKSGNKIQMSPKFRESAYTPLKKFFENNSGKDFESMKKSVDLAAEGATEKKKSVVEKLKRN